MLKEIDLMKILVGEIKGVKITLRNSCDEDNGRTVLGQLDVVTFPVKELLGSTKEPEANRQ
jgi:hypothetical protein